MPTVYVNENTKIYDIIYVGFGPATIFSVLKRSEMFNYEYILILEKGNSIYTRADNEVQNGMGGSGAFSDNKLVNDPLVGGSLCIPPYYNLSSDMFFKLADQVLFYYNKFKNQEKSYEWSEAKEFDTKDTNLKFQKSKVCHIGTNNSKEILKEIEFYLKNTCNIKFHKNIIHIEEHKHEGIVNSVIYEVFCDDGSSYFARNVVIATGPNDNLLKNLKTQFNLETYNNHIQLGIRVESDNSNGKWNKLIEANYDFKLVKHYKDGSRVRTFCANSGAAYVAKELNNGKFISYNGHAFKNNKEKENKLVNFGIICEVPLNLTKDEQIKICQDVNGVKESFKSFYKEPLLSIGCDGALESNYPKEVFDHICDFVDELSKLIDLKDTWYYAPEIKLISPKIKLNKDFSIHNNIYLIGDAGITRSIVQAGISGILVALNIK